MKKIFSFIVAIIIFGGIGYNYLKLSADIDENRENKNYSYISFEYPGGEIISIQIKEVPQSRCEAIREEYFQSANEQCKSCTVLYNECRSVKPELFSKAQASLNLQLSYIYKPYTFPEVTFFQGLPKESFPSICNMEKKSLASSVCVQ